MVIISEFPNIITYESSKMIIQQMENCTCKINIGNGFATGFFCKIPILENNKVLPILITVSHMLNEEFLYKVDSKILIQIKNEEDIKIIKLNNRIKYTNREFDITIIEIKEEDKIYDYLELDDLMINDILKNNINNEVYNKETIYAIQYPKGELSISYGIINRIYEDNRYHFTHKCSTIEGSAGAPILRVNNNKVIGIHHSGNKFFNNGTFLNYPIKEFVNLFYKKNKQVFNIIDNNEMLLKEFNKKYNLNIIDTKLERYDLKQLNLGNEGFKDLNNIELKYMKKLFLSYNNISDINILEKSKFFNLQVLDLKLNNISNINVLEKVNFKVLKELYLSHNDISDINVIVLFVQLEILDLSYNQISDISILEKVNFPNLKVLNLSDNNISDIKVFSKIKFEKLELLDLSSNKIDKISNSTIIANLKAAIKDFDI